MLKFGIITDTHIGVPLEVMDNSSSVEVVREFVRQMNEEYKPDFVVHLGDIIQDKSPQEDQERLRSSLSLFEPLQCPTYFVAGNHDLVHLSEAEAAKCFGRNRLYSSFEADTHKGIILHARTKNGFGNAEVSEEQLHWLSTELNTPKPVFVFIHYLLVDTDLDNNRWFQGAPENCLVENRDQVNAMLASAKNVKGVFNGHLHWNRFTARLGVPYFTIQAVVEKENLATKGKTAHASALVEFDEKSIKVRVQGNDPCEHSYGFA